MLAISAEHWSNNSMELVYLQRCQIPTRDFGLPNDLFSTLLRDSVRSSMHVGRGTVTADSCGKWLEAGLASEGREGTEAAKRERRWASSSTSVQIHVGERLRKRAGH